MLSWNKIEPPKLMFGNKETDTIPSHGLKNHGPYDGGTRIHLYIIAPYKHQRYTRKLVRGIEGSLRGLLHTEIEIVQELYLDKVDFARKNYRRAIINHVMEWRGDKKEAKLLLQIIPKRDTHPEGYYWILRKIALSEYDGSFALPVQTITVDKLIDYNRNYRRNYKKSQGLVDNLAIAFYAKVGLRPWIIAENISSCYDSVIYVGYDISYQHKTGQKGMGGIIIFDAKGQVIDFFDLDIQVEEGDRINEASFREFISRIIMSVEASKGRPDLIVFHRDGDYYYDEVQKIRSYMKREGYDYITLSFPKRRSAFPLFKRNKTIQLAESGYYAELGWQLAKDGKWYLTYGIQSLGEDIPIGVPPNILKFRLIEQRTEKRNCENILPDIMRQTFWLTRLNYATKFGYAKLPITVHYAHKLANVKRNAIKLAPFEKLKNNKPIWMI